MTLNDCNEYTDFVFGCKASFGAISETEASSMKNQSSSDSVYATGAVLIVAGVAYMVLRKRRTASIPDLEKKENNNFIIMRDGVAA